jgi:DNA-binding MarR family transcriptional regulator
VKKLDGQDIPPPELLAVMAAGRRIHAALDAVDALVSERLGLHRSDLRCLNLLEHGPLTAGEIAARTGLTSGAVTALVDRLERAGFVERVRSPEDRRSVRVAIPPGEYRRIAALYRIMGGSVTGRFAGRPAEEIAASARALEGFADALEQGLRRLQAGEEAP